MNLIALNERVSEIEAAVQARTLTELLSELARAPKLARNHSQRLEAWTTLYDHCKAQVERLETEPAPKRKRVDKPAAVAPASSGAATVAA